jgi:hypothetical protein
MVGRAIVAVLVVLGLVWMPLIESEKMNCFKSLIHKCPLAKKPSENQLKSPRNSPENKLEQTLGGGGAFSLTPPVATALNACHAKITKKDISNQTSYSVSIVPTNNIDI